jgi:hypothetical protein
MTDSPPNPESGGSAGSDKSAHQLQVEDELFRHRMALKQHGYQIISTEERLTLTVIQALAQAFLVIAAAAGFGVLLGLPTGEALDLLEHGVLVLTGFAFVCIGVFSFAFGDRGLVQAIFHLREGPPEPPDELSKLVEEPADSDENEQTA